MRSSIPLCVIWLGFSAVVVQVVLLRELLCLFSGNELVTGIVFGNWLLLTAAGSFLARFSSSVSKPLFWQSILLTILSLIAPLELCGLRYCRLFMDTGLVLGFDRVFLVSLLVLLPYCLVSGFLLTFFSTTFKTSSEKLHPVGQLYLMDTIGGALGGVIFGLFFTAYLSPFQSLFVLASLSCLASAMLSITGLKSKQRLLSLGLSAAVLTASVALACTGKVEQTTLSWFMKAQQLVEYRHTPYGTLSVFKEGKQFNFFENGIPTASTNDLISAESAVHFAMAQHPAPRNVLLVSGGLTGAYLELTKYPSVQNIDYVELDPAVIETTEKYVGKDPRVHAIVRDARQFISSKHSAYDVVVMSLPDPVNTQLNRYYTQEFFALVKNALSDGGVFGFQVSGAANYLNPGDRLFLASIRRALSASFSHIIFIPGSRIEVVASSAPLSLQIPELLAWRGIKAKYVNSSYVSSLLTPDRLSAIDKAVMQPAGSNTDFSPVGVYAHLTRWTEQFGGGLLAPSSLVLLIVTCMLALILCQPQRTVSFALSTTAFAGMGLQLVLLIAFQAYFGILYQQVGVLIASFLFGGAIGTYTANRPGARAAPGFFSVDLLMLVTAVCCAGIFSWTGFSPVATQFGLVLFPLLNAWTGFLVGAQFPLAARLLPCLPSAMTSTAGRLIALDLMGASAGAFLLSTFFIPAVGVIHVCFFLAFIKAISSLMTYLRMRRPEPDVMAVAPALGIRDMSFFVLASIFIFEGALIIDPGTSTGIYAVSFLPGYHAVLLILVGLGIVSAMDLTAVNEAYSKRFGAIKQSAERLFQLTGIRLSQWIYFAVFSVVLFFPIFKCYFQVPYLFCHVCPRKCPFGFLRPYIIPAALIMNLSKRTWCFHYCPVGTLQSCRSRNIHKAARIALRAVAVLILGVTVFSYFKINSDVQSAFKFNNDWYIALFRNNYDTSVWVLIIAGAILLISLFLPRIFCHGICPVGTFSALIQAGEKKTEGRLQSENE